jgi:hypothetical protein
MLMLSNHPRGAKLKAQSLKKRPDRNPASCKIQYPMKNHNKDAEKILINKLSCDYFYLINLLKMKMLQTV